MIITMFSEYSSSYIDSKLKKRKKCFPCDKNSFFMRTLQIYSINFLVKYTEILILFIIWYIIFLQLLLSCFSRV